jgi:hypothetical protein
MWLIQENVFLLFFDNSKVRRFFRLRKFLLIFFKIFRQILEKNHQ